MLAEAQRGLVEAGSPVAVEDFVAGAQRAADKITKDKLEQGIKAARDQMREAQDTMQMVETEQQRIAELEKQDRKGKKRVAGVAAERGGKAGKPTRKGQHILTYKNRAIGWQ